MSIRSFSDPNSTEARQFLLDRRSERKHPKRHRTKKRSRKMREARKARVKHIEAVKGRKRAAIEATDKSQ